VSKFCPKCGATDKDFYKGFCIECYVGDNRLVEAPRTLQVTRCRRCGRWLVRNRWAEDSFQRLLDLAGDRVKTQLNFPRLEADLQGDTLRVTVTGYLDPKRLMKASREAAMRLAFRDVVCPSCAKFANKYYEVKLQLRPSERTNARKLREATSFVRNRMRELAARDERASAFWEEENRDGIDFFFGFKQVGDAVYGALLDAFRPQHESSSQFLGLTREGKKKVRFTHCVRL